MQHFLPIATLLRHYILQLWLFVTIPTLYLSIETFFAVSTSSKCNVISYNCDLLSQLWFLYLIIATSSEWDFISQNFDFTSTNSRFMPLSCDFVSNSDFAFPSWDFFSPSCKCMSHSYDFLSHKCDFVSYNCNLIAHSYTALQKFGNALKNGVLDNIGMNPF